MRISPDDLNRAETPFSYCAADGKTIELCIIDLVASLLDFEHQDKDDVLIDVDLLDKIHNHPYF